MRYRDTRHPERAASALDELLAAEQEIAAQGAATAAECAALLDAARADAAVMTRDAADALDRELAAARNASHHRCDALVHDIELETARAIGHYRNLTEMDVDRLAEFVAVRVTGLAVPIAVGVAA